MSLPKGFKRLEYIQSSGTQYVDSGLKGNQNTRIDADYYTTATVGSIIGADSAWKSNMCTIEVHFAAFATSSYTYSSVPSGRHTVSLNKGVFSLDGTVLSTMTGTFNTPVNMTLFALNRNGSLAEYGTLKLYSMQIYDNGLLERDFVPCKNADGEVGLYDRVYHEFYRNAGTGEFTAGPEVEARSDGTQLEYIESDGTQWIDTGIIPDGNTRLTMNAQLTSLTNPSGSSPYLYGCYASTSTRFLARWYVAEAAFSTGFASSLYTFTTETNGLEPVVIDHNGPVMTINEETQTATSATMTTSLSVYLFARHTTSGQDYPASMKLFDCGFSTSGEAVRSYIPWLHPSGISGLLDTVNSRFYATASTTDFIAGPEAQTVPKAPANFRVESETDTLVTLAWDASDEVLGYRLYRQGQLLADTTETFVSVTVEPFSGAVFTLTAYNENGEGKGTSLTHYSIPENPLLYLITDRTAQDVSERNPKGYYAASDLNRVGYAMNYLANIIRGYGYTLEVHTKTDWTDEDWKLSGEMVKYLQSLNNLKAVFSTLVELPETMEKINYVDANNIEQLLLTIDETVARVVAGFTRANAFALRSGAKGLPVSQSDRGRNWGQLDAMETTWANWQLATWYLLLYGNLKAEGVVE